MKRTTLIGGTVALLGALLAVGLAAQGNPNRPPGQSQIGTPQTKPHVSISDEERADIFMARKSYDEAIEYYSLAVKAHPVSPQNRAEVAGLWNKIGICYQQELKYEKARDAYRKAIRLRHDMAQAWNNLGTTFYLNHRPKKSIKFYRRAIKFSPGSSTFHMNLGTAYFERKKYKRAFREYRTAVQLDPDVLRRTSHEGTSVETRYADARFYFYMAKIYASVDNPNEAVRYLRRAMEEGFNNRKRILDDPDLRKVSKDPAFIALMKNPPVAIKD